MTERGRAPHAPEGRGRRTHFQGTLFNSSYFVPGLLVRPAGDPASPLPRGRSGAGDPTNTRPRRNDERRPPMASAETRLPTARPRVVRCRPSSHRRLNRELCPVKRGRTRHAPSERALPVANALAVLGSVNRHHPELTDREGRRRRQIQRAPLSDGACRTQLFPPADSSAAVSLRERLCGATLGEGLGNRISADAVGRRGPFLEGRDSPDD